MKSEIWNGHNIRFIEKDPGDWWAVAADVCAILGLKNTTMALRAVKPENRTLNTIEGGLSGQNLNPDFSIINEKGIYSLIFKSRRKEAIEFQEWVFDILSNLRQATGLEGFQIFCMLDKDHQKEAMSRLNNGLSAPIKVDFIKANGIANKAISTKHGYPKMIKKGDMPPEMLAERQPILDDTVELMTANEKFGLNLSISKVIYGRYCG